VARGQFCNLWVKTAQVTPWKFIIRKMSSIQLFLEAPIASTIFVITILTSIQAFSDASLKKRFIFNPYLTFHHKQWYRLFSSGLIHGDWMHLAFNMFAFYFFALPLEAYIIGSWQFAVIYILSLGISSLPALYQHKDDGHYNALGASGAVSAVVLSLIVFIPDIPISVFFLPEIPGWLFAILYMGFSFYAGLKKLGNIGHEAHLFGAISGIVLTVLLNPEVATRFLQWINT